MPNGALNIKKQEVDSAIQNFDYETLQTHDLLFELANILKKIGEYRKILGR